MRFSTWAIAFCAVSYTAARLSSTSSSNTCPIQRLPTLIEAELEDLIAGLENGLFTSQQLVQAYIARIDEVNGTLHAVTELNPDALAIAQEADALRRRGIMLGPLHGIPILIKNNIATADHMNNTAGSWSLTGSRVPRDSTMAAKLRRAGAVILGKSNLSQWANFRSANSSNGWSALGGQTYGPYYPGQDPSGSSSGSGVATTLGLASVSLGTETSGSIISPAENNNLVGIKPTVGLTSRYLVIPISEHQDTIGPMARTVKDAAYVLQAIAGVDPQDNYTLASPFGDDLPDYVAACDYNSLAGKRIGVAWNVLDELAPVDENILVAFDIAIRDIEAAGATIVDANFTGIAGWRKDGNMSTVIKSDFWSPSGLAKYFKELIYNPNDIKSLEDVLEFTHSNSIEQWPFYDTILWESTIDQGIENTSPEFWAAYQVSLHYGGEAGILGALERANVSAVLLPSMLSTPIPALVGSPVITVPMGAMPPEAPVELTRGGNLIANGPNFPFGLSFLGPKWSEAELIGFAYAYEQRTMHRYDAAPYIQPTTGLGDFVSNGLSGSVENDICTKEFGERAAMFEEWPKIMETAGASMKRTWWSRYFEDTIRSIDSEGADNSNPEMEQM